MRLDSPLCPKCGEEMAHFPAFRLPSAYPGALPIFLCRYNCKKIGCGHTAPTGTGYSCEDAEWDAYRKAVLEDLKALEEELKEEGIRL